MNKRQFIRALSRRLGALSRKERQASLAYCTEMIQDHMESGASEEAAVVRLGSVDEIARQILADVGGGSPAPIRRERRGWNIALLILGAPLWLPLLIAALAVAFSLYAALWAVVISFYMAELGMAICGPAGLLGLIGGLAKGNLTQGAFLLAMGCAALGLALALLPWLNRLAGLLTHLAGWSMRAVVRIFRRRCVA